MQSYAPCPLQDHLAPLTLTPAFTLALAGARAPHPTSHSSCPHLSVVALAQHKRGALVASRCPLFLPDTLKGDTSGIRDSIVNQLLAKIDGVDAVRSS